MKKRSEVIELDISNKNLEGELKLDGFVKLQKLNCSGNKINKIDLSANEQLVEVDCSENKLTEIGLKNSKNLLKLHCQNNRLTNLDLSDCRNLEILKAHNSRSSLECFNNLSNISFLSQLPNPEKLKTLHLFANNIHSDLTPFACFTNLEDLDLGM